MKYSVQIEGKHFELELSQTGGETVVNLNGKENRLRLLEWDEPFLSFLMGNEVIEVETEKKEEGFQIKWRGQLFSAQVEDLRLAHLPRRVSTEPDSAKELKSPLPGIIVKIEVEEGQSVQAGQGILILEAMKMENEIKSPLRGQVKSILVKEKQTVDKGDSLIVFK